MISNPAAEISFISASFLKCFGCFIILISENIHYFFMQLPCKFLFHLYKKYAKLIEFIIYPEIRLSYPYETD